MDISKLYEEDTSLDYIEANDDLSLESGLDLMGDALDKISESLNQIESMITFESALTSSCSICTKCSLKVKSSFI